MLNLKNIIYNLKLIEKIKTHISSNSIIIFKYIYFNTKKLLFLFTIFI